jgi:hypothetical protein
MSVTNSSTEDDVHEILERASVYGEIRAVYLLVKQCVGLLEILREKPPGPQPELELRFLVGGCAIESEECPNLGLIPPLQDLLHQ